MKHLGYLVTALLFIGSALLLSTCKDEPDKPSISKLSPDTGKEGDVVTISGSFLGSTRKIKFGTLDAIPVGPKGGEVSTQVPAGAPVGKVSVTVTTDAGTSNALDFTVILPPPEITSITPNEAGNGADITIAGKHLANATEVAFGDVKATAAQLTSNADAQITLKVPATVGAGAVDVTVTTPGGTSSKATFTVIAVPTITGFTPPAGAAGTEVSITGTNLNHSPKVFFGDGQATTVNAQSDLLLVAVVPASATTGKIKVSTSGGDALSAADFIPKGAPVISSFTPTGAAVGTQITIAGQNFLTGAVVKFGGVVAGTTSITNESEIKANVPNGAASGKITIETVAGIGTSSSDFTVIGAPTVTNVNPTSGAVGSTVTLTGTNFVNVTNVKFNTTDVGAGNFSVVSATSMTVKVPSGASNGLITVYTGAGQGSSAISFTITGVPVVTSFAPTSGAVGATVTLTGTDLNNVTTVKFNGTSATIGTKTATSLTVTVPSGATNGTITATNSLGTGVSANSFTVIGAPAITVFSPTSGSAGMTITITGSNLSNASSVKFNGTAAVIGTNTATSITVTVPGGATTGTISVTTPGGTVTSAQTFTVAGAPTISSFTPTSGPVTTSVGLTGTNYVNISSVKFNGVEVGLANITINSLTSATVKVPAGATTGTISVTTPSGTGTSGSAFTVIQPPTISGFTPPSGAIGSTVTISGTNLSNATSVKVNGATATVGTNTAGSITATVPNTTTGKITVTTVAGTATSANNFTVIQPPSITSVSPTAGPAGTTLLTINGTSLLNASQVKFNATVVTSLTTNTDTQITVTVPGTLGAGAVNVSVVTPGGTSNTKTFTVTIPPSVTSIQPATSYPGFPIMVVGSNMKNATSIKIGSTSATINTLYDGSAIITIPSSMTNGTYQVTVVDAGGASNGVQLIVTTAPGGVGAPPGANFVSPPPANFINAVSNFWNNFGVLAQGGAGQCDIVDPGNSDNDPTPGNNYLCGTISFVKDGTGKVTANMVSITRGTFPLDADNTETFVGQWSATLPDPCIQNLVLISTKDGHVVQASVDIGSINPDFYHTGTCH